MGTIRLLLFLVCYSASAQLPVIPWRIPPSSSFNPKTVFGTNLIIWFEATDAKINTGKTHPLANGDTVTNWVVNNSAWTKSGTPDIYEVWWANNTGVTWWTNGGGVNGNQPRVAFTNSLGLNPVGATDGTLGGVQPITMAFVVQCTKAAGNFTALEGDTVNASLFRRDSDNSFALVSDTDLHGGTWTDTAFKYIVCVATNGGSLIRTNGVQVTSGNAGIKGIANNSSPAANWLMAQQSGGTFTWQGSICRMALWATNASASQITNIENWCIGSFEFPTHP